MRIRTVLTAAALAVGALATSALPASAGELCYDLEANVNGEAVVDESGCEELPL